MLGKLRKFPWGREKDQPEKKTAPANKPVEEETTTATHESTLLNDTSEKKRLAACARVSDTDVLLKVSENDSSEQVRAAAARQYARSLSDDSNSRNLLKQYASSSDKRHLALLITAHHADSDTRVYGISLFDLDNDYRQIALETRFHDTRDQVTNKIESLEVIGEVYRQIKARDKVVARKLKTRLQEHQKTVELAEEQQQRITKITEEMDRLANGIWSPNYITRYELFLNQWKTLDFEVSEKDRLHFNALEATARAKVTANREQQETQDALSADATHLNTLTQQINNSSLAELSAALQGSEEQTRHYRQKWIDVPRPVALDDKQQGHIENAISVTEKAQKQARSVAGVFAKINDEDSLDEDQLKANKSLLEKTLKTQTPGSKQPAYATELPALLQSVDQKLAQRKSLNDELKNAIHKQLGSLKSAIASNKWGPGKSIHDRLVKKIDRLPANDQSYFKDRLQSLETRLNELGDWKQFATEPKLAALCEEMEQLPARNLSPKDQASRIKELQDQWKAMGANPAQEEYWPRFKSAADIAFAPCAEYFAKRREDKERKIAQRTEIVEMLNKYAEQVNWENPDWRLVEKTIRTAKTEWRKLRVFDRKATQKQEQAFTVVLAKLNDKLTPAYENGKQEKENLIQRVKSLAEQDINQHCINQLKRLQAQWRRTGIVQRADDQRLWKEFNQACTDIYDVHRHQQKAQHAASVEHVTRARNIIKELRQAGTDGEVLNEKKLQQLQEEFQQLPEFPEKDQKFLLRDFNRAIDGLDKKRDNHSESALQRQLQRLRHNAALCDALETLAGQPPESVNNQMEQLINDWDDGQKTDNLEWRKAINLRRDSIVAHLQNNSTPDFSANTTARRLLCIDLEILLDAETPAEDKALRMQHQLDQLQQGMSAAKLESRQAQVQALEIQWLTAFPAEVDQRDKLQSRFNNALAKQ